MKIDVYTKCVLTVIALCLVWLALGGPAMLPAAAAQARPQPLAVPGERVVVVGWVDGQGLFHNLPNPGGGLNGIAVDSTP